MAQGLRAIAQKLTGTAKRSPLVARSGRPVRRRRLQTLIAVAAAALVVLGLAAWFCYSEHQTNEQLSAYLGQGNDLLNVGRYQKARQPFQEALRVDAANTQAKLGIGITDLAATAI